MLSSAEKFGYGEKIFFGRIDLAVLKDDIVDHKENIFILICGTKSFENDMIDNMALLGIPPSRYHKF